MAFHPVSDKVLDAVNAPGGLTAKQAKALYDEACRWKPTVGNDSFDEHHQKRRLLYEGKMTSLVEQELRKRYPATWRKMSVSTLNIVKLAADLDATTYDRPADRWVSRDGERLVSSASKDDEGNERPPDETAKRFETLLEMADLHSVMLEADRREQVAWTQYTRLGWDPLEDRPTIDPYWPADVYVVPHPLRPGSIRYALAVLLRCASGEGFGTKTDDVWYECWRRQTTIGPGGLPSFGSIRRDMLTLGKGAMTSEAYTGRNFPITVWHNGRAEGPFLDVDRDLVSTQLGFAVGWTNQFFTIDMQAHDELVRIRKPGKARGGQVVGGPGAVWDLAIGEDLKTVSRNPKLNESKDSLDAFLRIFAKTRRQTEDAYAKDHTAPLTGVSRKVKNATFDQASRERAHFARVHEERQLLPLLVEVADVFGGMGIDPRGELTYHFAPADPEEFEDPTQRDQRVDNAVDRGEISQARGAVLKGWYTDEVAASRAGLSTALETKKKPPVIVPQPDDEPDEMREGLDGAA